MRFWQRLFPQPVEEPTPQARAAAHRLTHLTEEVEHLKTSLSQEIQLTATLTTELITIKEVNHALQSKFDFCADQLQQERARNRELMDRLMALTDRRTYQTWKGEPPPPVVPAPPPPPPPEPEKIPTPEELEARFRMG